MVRSRHTGLFASEGRSLRGLTRAIFLFLAFFGVGNALRAQTPVREQELKATLLFNFCHFVQWPDRAFADSSAPFIIAILGRDPFGKFLDELVKGERTQGRAIEIRRFSRIEEITEVHLLYVSRSEQVRARSVVTALRGKAVFTVGEESEPAFTRAGGLVGFFVERGNIKLRINLDEARAVGITVSAKLLRLAEVVQMPNPP